VSAAGGTPLAAPRTPQFWFLTGSQHLYGPETLEQVASQSGQIQRLLADSGRLSAQIVGKPVLTDAPAIRSIMLEANTDPHCLGVIAWMHTFSPAKMWISGLHGLHEPEPGGAR
jgi:L-arabinose isomerase